ncbi:MAG: DUF1461 domain-containing protein [Opitutales bacterium]|nr:DUF1461 domain-containing protein [Opitutales bacterium]MCH8541351.1 DUF1461 domain-containing protein [Opitutales bacterium]
MTAKTWGFAPWGWTLLGTVCFFLCVLLFWVLVLSLPPVWSSFYEKVMGENLQAFPLAEAYHRDEAKISTAMWTREPFAQVSRRLEVVPLTGQEIKHYEDVRRLLRIALVFLIILLLAFCFMPKPFTARQLAVNTTLLFFFSIAVCGVWIWLSWRHFFHTFHNLLFTDDSWYFQGNYYILFLYPNKVWQAAGGFVAGGLLLTLVALFLYTYGKDVYSRKGWLRQEGVSTEKISQTTSDEEERA